MLSMLLLIALQDTDALIANAHVMTAAEVRCAPSADATDITVCGMRQADRYRVPLVVHDAGDRRYESVGAERERLLHRTNRIEDMSAFLVETGMAGVSASMTMGGPQAGQTGVRGMRKPAP